MDDFKTSLISDEELQSIEIRVNRATKGPWTSYIEGREEMSGSSFIMTKGEDIYISGGTIYDHDFIAAAREDLPRLIGEIRRLRSTIRTPSEDPS